MIDTGENLRPGLRGLRNRPEIRRVIYSTNAIVDAVAAVCGSDRAASWKELAQDLLRFDGRGTQARATRARVANRSAPECHLRPCDARRCARCSRRRPARADARPTSHRRASGSRRSPSEGVHRGREAALPGEPTSAQRSRVQVTGAKTIRARINALSSLEAGDVDEVVRLRLDLIGHRVTLLGQILDQETQATAELKKLTTATNTTLTEIVGIAERAAAELLVEVGDVRRFTQAGFARFNGTAPIPASSGEGAGEPIRHRLSRGGNRRINAVLHRMAMIQLRCDPRARQLYDNARQAGHTRREAMRILKRHLSKIVYRTMLRDAQHPAP